MCLRRQAGGDPSKWSDVELSDEARAVEAGIDVLLAVGSPLRLLVADYLSDDDPGFTGRHFHTFGDQGAPGWELDDLAAPALLDTPIGGYGLERILISERERFNELLAAVPVHVTIWDDGHGAVTAALDHATDLYSALLSIRGVGHTRAHKLIARKRPRLHPVYDSVVAAWFLGSNGLRYPLAELVAAGCSPRKRIRAKFDPARVTDLDELQLLDIAVWMCGSRSPAAGQVRNSRGVTALPPDRLPKRRRR